MPYNGSFLVCNFHPTCSHLVIGLSKPDQALTKAEGSQFHHESCVTTARFVLGEGRRGSQTGWQTMIIGDCGYL